MNNPSIPSIPFYKLLYTSRENKRLYWFAGIVIVIQFVWFKMDCFYPNIIPDTYSYVLGAYNNDFIHIRPIGYSKFLRFFSVFTRSHLLLVLSQYLLLQAGVLYFFFTLRYLLNPGKWVLRVLLAFTLLNPLLVKVSNFITSDALFTSLSLVWFTQLLWLLYIPSRKLLLAHAVVLLLAFSVRYNALYYPFISVTCIIIAQLRLKTKLIAIVGMAIPLFVFIVATEYEYKKTTGATQFSAFGGWQLAINGLHAYAHDPLVPVASVPAPFRALHAIVNRHMDSLNHLRYRPDAVLGVYYLSDTKSPLNIYFFGDTSSPSIRGYENRWLRMGPLYGEYGTYLIKQHRNAYFQHFLLPNLGNYMEPPSEMMGYYQLNKATLFPLFVNWFRFPSNKLYTYFEDPRIRVINVLPRLFAIVNLFFVLTAMGFIIWCGPVKPKELAHRILLITVLCWLSNFVFSVSASVIVLRYQIFPFIMVYSFGVLLAVLLWQKLYGLLNLSGSASPVSIH